MKSKKKVAQKKVSAPKSAASVAVARAEPVAPPPAPLSILAEPLAEEPATPEVASERRPISQGERRRMIEVSAYHRAARIGFGATDPVEDWLAAEREVDAMLVHGPTL